MGKEQKKASEKTGSKLAEQSPDKNPPGKVRAKQDERISELLSELMEFRREKALRKKKKRKKIEKTTRKIRQVLDDSPGPVASVGDVVTLADRVYPEFGGLTAAEIFMRLETLKNMTVGQVRSDLLLPLNAPVPGQIPGEEPTQTTRETPAPPTGKPEEKDYTRPPLKSEESLEHNFLVIAHRGWSGSYPENTLIGMREAIKLGCHMIEFDVTLSRDRKLVIFHDQELSRTTNGVGLVRETDFRDLRKLDAGSWFHPRYKGTRLPTLDEILLICRSSRIQVNIEIKKEAWDEEPAHDNVENQVVRAIDRYGVRDRVLISSFRWSFIERIRALEPGIRTALLHYKDVGKLKPKKLRERYGIVAFNPHCVDLTQKFVEDCHAAGLKVFPFTINNYEDMEQYFNMGVDGMFTNHPNRLFNFIEEHNIRLAHLRKRDQVEDHKDMVAALARLEQEEIGKAMKRARWRAKRELLSSLGESEEGQNARGEEKTPN